jgi:hypothetical protein
LGLSPEVFEVYIQELKRSIRLASTSQDLKIPKSFVPDFPDASLEP